MKKSIPLALLALLAAASAAADTLPRWQQSPQQLKEAVSRVRAGTDLTPASWPGGARVAVSLSFDVDTELVWLEERD